MGIGHHAQFSFEKTNWKHRFCSGGTLRQARRGRKARPLSTKASVHLVFKADKANMRRGLRSLVGFQICHKIIKIYAKRFHIKIAELAICQDHLHLIIRCSKRSLAQNFFRVVAGQIAQQFTAKQFLVNYYPVLVEIPAFYQSHSGMECVFASA